MPTKKQISGNEPQTMEELLSSSGYNLHVLKRGETVTGIVTAISPKSVSIDLGAKTEGVIADRWYQFSAEYIKTLKVGDEVSAQIISPESESGQIILSLRKSASSQAWKKLQEIAEADGELEVVVRDTTRAGLLVEAHDTAGFIPNSQISSDLLADLSNLISKKIKVKIREVDPENDKLILSEKAVSEKEIIAQAHDALNQIQVGDILTGVVTQIAPFGVFVKVKLDNAEIEGLIHISELAWDKIEDPKALVSENEEILVKVIGVERGEGRLSLSLKQLTDDPWLDLVQKYPLESHVSGIVSKLSSFGAFIEIEPNLTGLLHISKIPPEKKINVGDKINCFVEEIEPEKRRLSLGLVLSEKPVGYK